MIRLALERNALERMKTMDNTNFNEKNIYFYDKIIIALESLPSKVIFLVDENVLTKTSELSMFLKDKKTMVLNLDESQKNLQTVERIYEFLFLNQTTEILVAIGGGILGDVALYAAATFKRGIPFIVVPTTLLSMVDSSIGGKSGVNYKGIKNYIGVFKNPDQVLIAPSFLKTLELKELRSGLGELFKYALLGEKDIEEELRNKQDFASLPYDKLIEKALRFKSIVVEKDFRDLGHRNILNLGHNTAHGLETLSKGALTHGEAVALGLLVELWLSEKMFMLPKSVRDDLENLMKSFGMRTTYPIKDYEELILAMEKDKKNDESMRFTLLRHVGQPIIKTTVKKEDLISAFNVIME